MDLFYKFYNYNNLEYNWANNSYCPSFYKIEEYHQLAEAKDGCSINSSCTSIYDEYCDSQTFWTCSEDILPSVVGSCTWILEKKGMNGHM